MANQAWAKQVKDWKIEVRGWARRGPVTFEPPRCSAACGDTVYISAPESHQCVCVSDVSNALSGTCREAIRKHWSCLDNQYLLSLSGRHALMFHRSHITSHEDPSCTGIPHVHVQGVHHVQESLSRLDPSCTGMTLGGSPSTVVVGGVG